MPGVNVGFVSRRLALGHHYVLVAHNAHTESTLLAQNFAHAVSGEIWPPACDVKV